MRAPCFGGTIFDSRVLRGTRKTLAPPCFTVGTPYKNIRRWLSQGTSLSIVITAIPLQFAFIILNNRSVPGARFSIYVLLDAS